MDQRQLTRFLLGAAVVAHIAALLAFALAAHSLSDDSSPDTAAGCERWCGPEAERMLWSALWAATPLLLWYPWFILGAALRDTPSRRPLAVVQFLGAFPFLWLNAYAWAKEGVWDDGSWQWVVGMALALLDMAAAVAIATSSRTRPTPPRAQRDGSRPRGRAA